MANTVSLVDLLHLDGTPNPSGLTTMHGIALMAWFAAAGIQKPDKLDGADATNISVGSITTPHTFIATKCMKKAYSSENKGDVKDDVVGDPDSQTGKCTGSLMVPGVKAEYITAKKLYNCSLGIAFVTLADGQVMQYGSEDFPCHFKVTWGSDKNEGYRGYTITFTCYGDGILYTPGLNFTPAA
jgi:hypothetical protein